MKKIKKNAKNDAKCTLHLFSGWLDVFYVPSRARSFRDGNLTYCPLRRM